MNVPDALGPLNPIDLGAGALVVATTLLAAHRGWVGLLAGAAGVALLKPLLLLAAASPLAALSAAALLGLFLSVCLRPFPQLSRRSSNAAHAFGALGGLLLGSTLVLAFAVSLPVAQSAASGVRYPAVGAPWEGVFRTSRLIHAGRAIVLYPLSAEHGSQRSALGWLHGLLIARSPWEGG